MQRIGVHISIAGGLEKALFRAKDLGINTIQIFSHNPRSWKRKPLDAREVSLFKKRRSDFNISPLFIHASYLINLASLNPILLRQSSALLSFELNRADEMGADYVVLHPGSASGDDKERAQKRIISSLNHVLSKKKWKTGILLENTSGARGDLSSRITNLGNIMEHLDYEGVSGICFDTCHAFSAGYDFYSTETVDSLLEEIENLMGIASLKLIHLNDSKGDKGSHFDRHEHIGKGKIGIKGFKLIFSRKAFRQTPIILETPKKNPNDDRENLKKVHQILNH